MATLQITSQVITGMVNFVSLGKSCQTTHQITHFADNNPLQADVVKSPFDWLICPPDSAAAWLDEDLRNFDPDELIQYRDRAYWPYFKLWFWHGFLDRSTDHPQLKIAEFAEQELAKLNHLRDKFQALDLSCTQFILSNTQNNLSTEVFEPDEWVSYKFDEEKIDTLQTALDHFFGQATSLQVITRTDLGTPGLLERDNVHILPTDQSNWKGNKAAWSDLLQDLVDS